MSTGTQVPLGGGVECMCYARGALISQELLSRVRQASRELFSQNEDWELSDCLKLIPRSSFMQLLVHECLLLLYFSVHSTQKFVSAS